MAQSGGDKMDDECEEIMEEEEEDEEGMESEDDEDEDGFGDEDDEDDEEEQHHLIDAIRTIGGATALSQLLILARVAGGAHASVSGGSEAGGNGERHSAVPSLQVQSLVSIIDADLSAKAWKSEPEDILVDTCSQITTALQCVYQKIQKNDALVADSDGMDALYQALSARIPSIPDDRRHNIDGCTNIIIPPDTSDQIQPSTVVKDVEDCLKINKTLGEILQVQVFGEEDGAAGKSVEELRVKVKNPKGGSFLNTAIILMMDRSFEDCLDAFSHPRKQECGVDELIDDFANGRDAEEAHQKVRTNTTTVCLFAGVVRSLHDLKDYRNKQDEKFESVAEEKSERDSEGHLVFEEEEPEMYYGWHGSWPVDEDRPSKNSIFYGVKLGAILHYAEGQAKKMLKKAPAGSKYSLPRAKFHLDMSANDEGARPKATDTTTTSNDFAICRAHHEYIESDAFGGDNSSAYSSKLWAHDVTIGFSHFGAGWKNREFCGHLYGFDLSGQSTRTFTSQEIGSEFWSTPSSMHADSTNKIVWVQADRRIKGFTTDTWSSSYVFALAKSPKKEAKPQSASSPKRQRVSISVEEGNRNIIVFGSERIGYLQNGILQEWNLNEANRHDGVQRMVSMCNIDEDIAQWNADEIINLSANTYMDEEGEAEVTAGVRPDSIRRVDISAPHSIGYLSRGQLAFAPARSSQIPIYDLGLREISRLVGFGNDSIEIVQRPSFEGVGGEDTFVASDKTCVKIFDLRSGKAEVTIHQKCINSTPICVSGAKFVCNKLRAGKGVMMWDLRSQNPLYSLPISGNTDIAWVPTLDGSSKPPILITSTGECYKFGVDFPQDDEWEMKSALQAWSELEKKDKTSDSSGDCCIM